MISTLHRKINIGMFTGLVLMFLTVFVIIFCVERQYYRLHLDRSTQNIEVSLSVFLATPLYDENYKLVSSLVNKIFDEGFFRSIQVRDANNEILVSRKNVRGTEFAPAWFVDLVRWPETAEARFVMNKQAVVGQVLVNPSVSRAYDALWHSLVVLMAWFLFWILASLWVSYYFSRWLLKPFQQITKQATALGKKQFVFDTQTPTILEFKTMSLVMNQLVSTLKNIFQRQLATMEALRCDLFLDNLTGLGNHRYFLYQLTRLLYRDEELTPGFIIGISLEDILQIKENLGETKTNLLIQEIGSMCLKFWQSYPELVITRSEESRFALIIRENDERLLIAKCEEFNAKLQKLVSKKTYCEIYFSVVSYLGYQDKTKLLAELNQTLQRSKNEPAHLGLSPNLLTHGQIQITKEELTYALNQQIECLSERAVSNGVKILHYVISTTLFINDERVNSYYVQPSLRAAGLIRQIDGFILEEICEKELLGMHPIAFTLSQESLTDERIFIQNLNKLKVLPKAARERLSFEVDEFFVIHYGSYAMQVFKEFHALGIKLGVTQVGIQSRVMSYLNELPLAYLKLHGSLSHDPDEDTPFVIHYLQEMAAMLGFSIIATQVQSAEEWQLLKKKGIVWGHGIYFDTL